jgi:hypothetical protein
MNIFEIVVISVILGSLSLAMTDKISKLGIRYYVYDDKCFVVETHTLKKLTANRLIQRTCEGITMLDHEVDK